MQQADFTRFRAVMTGMGELYQRELSGPLLDAYWLALRDWPLAEFEAAAAHLMATATFMPRPAEFNALRKAGRQTAGEAWLAVLENVPEMAAHLGVSEATVVRAIHGRTYKTVGRPAPQGGPQLAPGISRG